MCICLNTLPFSSAGKESACSAGDLSSIPGSGRTLAKGESTHSSILGLPWWLSWWTAYLQYGRPGFGRSLGEGKVCPLQYYGLENSMDSIVHRVAKNWTRLNDFKLAFNTLKNTLFSMFFNLNSFLFLFCETIKCEPGRYNYIYCMYYIITMEKVRWNRWRER